VNYIKVQIACTLHQSGCNPQAFLQMWNIFQKNKPVIMECVQVKDEPVEVGECSLEMRLDEYPTNTTIKCEVCTCVSHTSVLSDLHDHIPCDVHRLLDNVEANNKM
jgi:hypothetical protein